MPLQSLGNVVPTDDEKKRMFAVLDGLRERLNSRGSNFAAPTYNEKGSTFELRWIDGSREWISAWIDGLCKGRRLCVWRHPSYRFGCDEHYIYENSKTN